LKIFYLLFRDELSGFYKSKVMLILWIGLPLIAIMSFVFLPESEIDISLGIATSSIVSGLGGLLAAMMLAIHIIHEKSRNVYELFLIRPVKKSYIILAKFFSVFLCVALACLLAISLGFSIDFLFLNRFSSHLFENAIDSFIISLSIIAIDCALGALVGIIASSVIVGIILVYIAYNFASLSVILPIISKMDHPVLMAMVSGFVLSSLFLILAIWFFKKKQF